MQLFIHLLLCIIKMPSFIKNIDLPACVNCIHFIEDPYTSYDAKCKKMGIKNFSLLIFDPLRYKDRSHSII